MRPRRKAWTASRDSSNHSTNLNRLTGSGTAGNPRAARLNVTRPTEPRPVSITSKNSSDGKNVAKSRKADERKWIAEWAKLEQRRRLLENELHSTATRKMKYASQVLKRCWEDILRQTTGYKLSIVEEKRLLQNALDGARRSVQDFVQEVQVLRTEGGARPETIKRVRLSMEHVEDKLLDFKRNARHTYENMMATEEELTSWLQGALDRAESVANAAAARTNTEKKEGKETALATREGYVDKKIVKSEGIITKTRINAEQKRTRGESEEEEAMRKIEEIEAEIQENGGERGLWSLEDHQMYLKLRQQIQSTDAMLQKAATTIPLQDLYSVSAHHAWILRYKQLLGEKKRVVKQWKQAKAEAVAKAAARAREIELRKEESRKANSKQRLKAQREKAAKVKAWKEQKREKELRELAEKRRKAKILAQKKAQELLQEAAQKKAELIAIKKRQEEEKMQQEMENKRAEKVIKQAEAKRKQILRERVERRNIRDAEKRAAKIREKQMMAIQARRREQALVKASRPNIQVESKFKEKTALQKEREALRAFERRHGLQHGNDGRSTAQHRPAYLGAGRATPSWMK